MKRPVLLVCAALAGVLAAGATCAQSPATARSTGPAAATLPFSEIMRAGNTLYLSGQIGTLPGTDVLAEGGITAQTRQAMDNIKALLESSGYSMRNLVKCTAMLADIRDWAAFNEVYRTYFDGHFPARSAFAVTGLALGARVEIECVATTTPRD